LDQFKAGVFAEDHAQFGFDPILVGLHSKNFIQESSERCLEGHAVQLPEIQGGEWIVAFERRGRLPLELLHLFELLERDHKRWQTGFVGVD